MKRHTVDGTEMVFDACKLLLKYQMKKSSLEFARFAVDGGIHSLLTTSQQHMILNW